MVLFSVFWKGCGENDIEAHAGVFWDWFWWF